jgi:short-subunit dehydrogenase
MTVNFFGAMHCTHAALEPLISRRGMIIVISSVAGFAPLIARTGYAASKHALHGFFDSLRSEVEPLGVKVLLVCPSFIQTGIEKNALAGDGDLASHPQSIVASEPRRMRLPERYSLRQRKSGTCCYQTLCRDHPGGCRDLRLDFKGD